MRDVTVSGESAIRLGQFLKLADAVQSGAEVKSVLAEGIVRVNDEAETRRGRQLADGDVVDVAGERLRVRVQPG